MTMEFRLKTLRRFYRTFHSEQLFVIRAFSLKQSGKDFLRDLYLSGRPTRVCPIKHGKSGFHFIMYMSLDTMASESNKALVTCFTCVKSNSLRNSIVATVGKHAEFRSYSTTVLVFSGFFCGGFLILTRLRRPPTLEATL